MMAHSQDANSSLHIEIQRLKEALDASQKQNDQYAHLIATLSQQLNELRENICHACKVKVVLGNVSPPSAAVTAPSAGSRSSGFSPSGFTSPLRPIFQSRESQPLSRSSVKTTTARNPPNRLVIPTPTVYNTSFPVPSGLAAMPGLTATTIGGPDITPPKLNSKLPEWSVVHNPEVEKASDLHLAHVFTYKSLVTCVNISPDGQRVAIGLATDGKTYINEVETGSNICTFVDCYIKEPLDIWSVQFSPDGQLLATGTSDDNIRIWDIRQKRMRAMFKGHKRVVAFSSNGRFLVSGSDYSVRIWDIRSGSSRELINDSNADLCFSAVFSPAGKYIAAGKSDGRLSIWDVRTTRLIARWKGHTSAVWSVKFTPDGKGLMSGSKDKTFIYWDASCLGIYKMQSEKRVVVPGQIRRFEGHTDGVRSILVFPRNSRWVSCSEDESVRIWDLETGVCLLTLQGTLQGYTDFVRLVDVSRTENLLATASRYHATLWKYEPVP